MPGEHTTIIHGVKVKQIDYRGNMYTPVSERVKIAETVDPATIRKKGAGYCVTSVQIIQVGDRWAYHCMVEYPAASGNIKPGTDYIDLKDNTGIAKAETSAIGRALGLHGIASEYSIASADEMEHMGDGSAPTSQETLQHTAANTPAQPTIAQLQKAVADACKQHGIDKAALDDFCIRHNLTAKSATDCETLLRILCHPGDEPDFADIWVTQWAIANGLNFGLVSSQMARNACKGLQAQMTALQKDPLQWLTIINPLPVA